MYNIYSACTPSVMCHTTYLYKIEFHLLTENKKEGPNCCEIVLHTWEDLKNAHILLTNEWLLLAPLLGASSPTHLI